MNTPTIEIAGNVPTRPSFIFPSGADLAVVKELERILGGRERVVWMVESALRPAPELMQYLQENRCSGFLTALEQSGSEPVVQRISRMLQSGCHVVFLSTAAMPAPLLSFADGSSLPVVPLGVQMMGESPELGLNSPLGYTHLRLHFMPELAAGASMGVRVRTAWQNATAEALAHHPAVELASLPHALLKSMLRHQESVMVDGVDDSKITYRRVLACAMLLCSRLRRYTAGKRLGIILPPGKRAVIANLACLFAGIVPVNVDYTATEAEFAHICATAHIDRFISSERFIHKQEKFCWPNRRDIIFIDKELHSFGRFRLRVCEWMLKTTGKACIAARRKVKRPEPAAEALFAFTPAGREPARAMAYSHRAVMAALLQWQQCLHLNAEDAVLFSQPLYRADAVLPGLLLPLLLGQKVVMYPTPVAGKRLCELVKNYRTAHAVFRAEEARTLFQAATREHMAALQYLMMPAEPAAPDLVQEAVQRFGVSVQAYTTLPEFVAPLSIASHGIGGQEEPTARPEAEPGARVIGRLLPGVSLRVSEFFDAACTVSPDAVGVVHISGPSMASPAGQAASSSGACYTFGNAGCADADGKLTLLGPVERYSRVNGELVSHEKAESVVLEALETKQLPGMPRRVAIVALPGQHKGADMLVLLSTIHQQVFSHDVSNLFHKIKNLKYSPNWAPKHIIPVQAIPTLPDGSLNYDFCRRGIRRTLGIPEPTA